VADCDRMLAAADAAGRQLMIGHCIRFWGEYAEAARIARSGQYGPVRTLTLTRYGAIPSFGARNWFHDPAKSGSAVLDLHIHDVDYALFALGKPASVRARGVPGPAGGTHHVVADYDYGSDGPVVSAEGAWQARPNRPLRLALRGGQSGARRPAHLQRLRRRDGPLHRLRHRRQTQHDRPTRLLPRFGGGGHRRDREYSS